MLSKEQVYECLSNVITSFAVALDDRGNIFLINQPGCKLLGYSENELIGENWFKKCLPRDSAKESRNEFKQMMAGDVLLGGEDNSLVTTKLKENKEIIWRRFALKDQSGEVVGILLLGDDALDRKLMREELSQAQMIIENSSAVIYRVRSSRGWPLEFISKNISQYGYSDDEFISGAIKMANIISPDDLERSFRETEDFFAKNIFLRNFRHEYCILTKDKKIRWVEDLVEIIRDYSGTATHYQGTLVDITDRKIMEEELSLSNIVIENSSIVLYRLRFIADWPLEYISKNIKRWGYVAEDFLAGGMKFFDIIYPEDRERVLAGQQEFVRQLVDHFLRQEYRLVAKDGGIHWVENVSELVRGSDIRPTHIQGTIIDITERKKAEQKINERNKELVTMNSLMIDRELKMASLKERVKQLEGVIQNSKSNK